MVKACNRRCDFSSRDVFVILLDYLQRLLQFRPPSLVMAQRKLVPLIKVLAAALAMIYPFCRNLIYIETQAIKRNSSNYIK